MSEPKVKKIMVDPTVTWGCSDGCCEGYDDQEGMHELWSITQNLQLSRENKTYLDPTYSAPIIFMFVSK